MTGKARISEPYRFVKSLFKRQSPIQPRYNENRLKTIFNNNQCLFLDRNILLNIPREMKLSIVYAPEVGYAQVGKGDLNEMRDKIGTDKLVGFELYRVNSFYFVNYKPSKATKQQKELFLKLNTLVIDIGKANEGQIALYPLDNLTKAIVEINNINHGSIMDKWIKGEFE